MKSTLEDLDLEEIASSVYPKITAQDLSFLTDDGIKESSRIAGSALFEEAMLKVFASTIRVQYWMLHETNKNIVKETLSLAFHQLKDTPYRLLPLCWDISPRDDTKYYFPGHAHLAKLTRKAFQELLHEYKLDFAKLLAEYRAVNPLHDLGLLTPVIEKYLEGKGDPEAAQAEAAQAPEGEVENVSSTQNIPNDFVQELGRLLLALIREKSKSPDISIAESIRLSIDDWTSEETKLEDVQKVAVWVGTQVGHHELVTDDFVIALWRVITEIEAPSIKSTVSTADVARDDVAEKKDVRDIPEAESRSDLRWTSS
jgi:hypothetical protein